MKTLWHSIVEAFGRLHLQGWWNGLVSATPPTQWKFMWGYVALIGICLVAGIGIVFVKRLRADVRSRISTTLIGHALLGGILFFFRYYQVPLLGMDLLRLVQEMYLVVWSGLMLRYMLTSYRKEEFAKQVEDYKSRYLPKPKRA